MTRIPERLRQEVRKRAEGMCEYCLIHEDDMLIPFHVDHIIAEQHHGLTTLENLAWSCYECNNFKGPNISSIDPKTGKLAPLFNPRTQQWSRHFRLNGPRIDPLTASGRATESLLNFNTPTRIQERLALMEDDHYPQR